MSSHSTCSSAGKVTAQLLLSFLTFSAPIAASQQPFLSNPLLPVGQKAPSEHVFSLRHVFHHGTYEHPRLHKQIDIADSESTVWVESEDGPLQQVTTPLRARSSCMTIERLKDRRPSVVEPMVAAARVDSEVWAFMSPSAWTVDDRPGPNITDKETIITLAQMAANAYVPEPETGEWKDVNGGFNRTDDYGFGWDGHGLRGYIYTDESNSTVVIGLKGTSLAVYDGEGTTTQDKENDNLYFSCCCGQQGSYLYRQVCDCATGAYTCNTTCLKKKLKEENRYYMAARHLYSNVTALYPDSNIWMSGHSLGGSLGAMLGLTYGIPVVTFEAVPDALPAGRLGLPSPPGSNPNTPQVRENTGAFHFGNTADPVYLGICNGATASCTYAGYALESACHTGKECVYDVVGDLGWGVHIWSHKIVNVIESIIKKYDAVPECRFTPECQDCPLWKEVTGNSTSTASSSSSTTRTQTRTSTCKTPGWWGCLDETTTTSGTTTSEVTTTSTSTSTCKTPGWFGCNDKTTTTESVSTVPTASQTSTCQSPGFFGCRDPTTSTSPTSECKTPGVIWGCKDKTMSMTHSITSPPVMPSSTMSSTPTRSPDARESHCVHRYWFGLCKRWDENERKMEI